MKAATDTGVTKEGAFGISIHAAREGGDFSCSLLGVTSIISIHAAREGGDIDLYYIDPSDSISIHAAREGGDWTTRR